MAAMTRRLPNDEVLKAWDDGHSVGDLCRMFEVSRVPIVRILHANGRETRRPMTPLKFALDPAVAADLHLNRNLSVKAIAELLGKPRTTVVTALNRAGVRQRNRSESMFVRMSQTDEAERMRLTNKAHEACRGRKRPESEGKRLAESRMRTGRLSFIENVFADAFARLGVPVVPQYAHGPYNCDFALPASCIDIEIDPGCWHKTKIKRPFDERRDVYFAETGWKVLRWSGNKIRKSNANLTAVAEELIRRDLATFLPT